MSLLDYFRPTTLRKANASVAKERLQIIVAHQRSNSQTEDYLPLLQKELMEVISKYVKVNQEQVKVALDRNGDCSVLELNIVLPQ